MSAYFSFKQFRVRHDRVTMKVGTDGVLLGAWTNVDRAGSILDVGSGSGVIALMLAQRTPDKVRIDAIEIAETDYAQGKENFEASPWRKRITAIHASLQDFTGGPYDLVVSNPPYFSNSLLPPDARRQQVRHTQTLSADELLRGASRLLTTSGRLSVILPYTEAGLFEKSADHYKLYCLRRTFFRTRRHKPIERVLMEFGSTSSPCQEDELLLYGDDGNRSAGYVALTHEFYL